MDESTLVASQWAKRRGFRMRLELPTPRFYLAEALSGIARVESISKSAVELCNLRVSLWAFSSDGSSSISTSETLVNRETLTPLEHRTYPLAMPLPVSGVVGGGKLYLSAGGPLQLASGASLQVLIAPERRLAALVELVAELSQHNIDGWSLAGAGDGYFAQLKTAPEIEDRILGIGVEIYPNRGGVYGTINVVPRDRGLRGVVQAAALAEGRSHRFRFKTCDLTAARREFEAFLLPFVNDLHDLPIPSQNTIALEGLPVPSRNEANS